MFYEKLYKQYYENEKKLRRCILYLKEKYSKDIENEDLQTCRRISLLYGMYLDLKYVTNLLKSKCEVYDDKNFKL